MTSNDLARFLGEKRGCNIFVFGSWLKSASPSDVDLLLVYDEARHSPSDFLQVSKLIGDMLRRYFARPVHLVRLTVREEAEVRFVEREGCVPLVDILQHGDV
jgi:predicted nucleotidyltransferase